jgi:hypothetical protein
MDYVVLIDFNVLHRGLILPAYDDSDLDQLFLLNGKCVHVAAFLALDQPALF